MARDLTAATKTEFTAQSFRPILFFEGEFASGTVNLWSGLGTLSWDSKNWTGLGDLTSVTAIQETAEFGASNVTVQLTGIPSEYTALALDECRQGKPGRIWLGAMTGSGSVVADPYKSYQGRLDVAVINETGESATIQITYESRYINGRPKERRYTHQDQQIDYPGDRGFEYMTSLQDAQINWGQG